MKRILPWLVLLTALGSEASAFGSAKFYLVIGEGPGAQARVYKSQAACENARRKFAAEMARINKRFEKYLREQKLPGFTGNPRCLNFLPEGFE